MVTWLRTKGGGVSITSPGPEVGLGVEWRALPEMGPCQGLHAWRRDGPDISPLLWKEGRESLSVLDLFWVGEKSSLETQSLRPVMTLDVYSLYMWSPRGRISIESLWGPGSPSLWALGSQECQEDSGALHPLLLGSLPCRDAIGPGQPE